MKFQLLIYFCRTSWNLWGSITTVEKCEALEIWIILMCFSEDYETKLDLIVAKEQRERSLN